MSGPLLGMLGVAILLLLLFFSLVPLAMMLLLSLKSNADIFTDFWGLPARPRYRHVRRGLARCAAADHRNATTSRCIRPSDSPVAPVVATGCCSTSAM